MKRSILSATAVAIAFGIAIGGLAGCGTPARDEQSNIPQSASMEPNLSSVNISVTGYRLGSGSWNVDASTATGASSGSLGDQKVLVCDLLLTNKSSENTVISPIDLLSASQDGETLQFGALYNEDGSYRNPESVEVEPGQTVSGIDIWNIDDLHTPVKIKFKCGGEPSLTIMPSRLSEGDSK
mgnify:CR=1 FL=1